MIALSLLLPSIIWKLLYVLYCCFVLFCFLVSEFSLYSSKSVLSLNVTGNMSWSFTLFSLMLPCLDSSAHLPTQYQLRRLLDTPQDQLKGSSEVFSFVTLSLLGRADQLSWIGTLCLLPLKYWSWYSMAICWPMPSVNHNMQRAWHIEIVPQNVCGAE